MQWTVLNFTVFATFHMEDYVEGIMKLENDLYHDMKSDTMESPVVYLSRDVVVGTLR